VTDQELKRRRDQSKFDRELEQDRRDHHLHDEARLRPSVVAGGSAKPQENAGLGHNRGPPLGRDEEVLGDDLLFGADEVAAYLKRPRRWVYNKQKALQLIHLDGGLVGSKSKLTKLLAT
jgi:hypothetical protein